MSVFGADASLVAAYQRLSRDLSRGPDKTAADLRRHARYPETLFRVQAEIYRTYHMLDPQSFYNKEDLWDLAKTSTQNGTPEPMTPTYIVANLPGETKEEFLLMTSFTHRNKDNLIGAMLPPSDHPQLGQM